LKILRDYFTPSARMAWNRKFAVANLAPAMNCPMKIHHLGIAVESLVTAVPAFEALLGQRPQSEESVADQHVRVATFRVGESHIELLEATLPESPIGRFVAKRGPGIHHLALTVPDLPRTLAELEAKGVKLIDREPRVGAGNERIAFLHPSSTAGVLIELVEEK
jgi:methylmalonyl-CoA/ethylmalonyl-CoA epimerase